MIRDAIAIVAAGRDLTEEQAAAAMEEMMTGEATAGQVGALLAAMRMKGESVDEMVGMARVMRNKLVPLPLKGDLLDVVSTGGGSVDPFNISTAAALVCAGAGVRIAKHGNRGFTSTSGAADVLEALGAKVELTPEQVAVCIEKSGFGFLFAPAFHPSMRFVGPTRREIGIRTIFNSLGPVTNPAGAQYQLIGVGDASLVDKVSQALARLGTAHSLIVHSDDGLDEVSLSAPNAVREIRGAEVKSYTLAPEDAGFARVPLAAVKTGTAAENAERLRDVLAGAKGADREYTLINAAAGLYAADRAKTIAEGVVLAKQAIDSGAAAQVLAAFVAATQSFGEGA
jgi:anthranilate phosphoribosyltransferase